MKLNNDTLIFKGSTPWEGQIFRGTTLIWPTVPPRDYSAEYFTLEVIDTGNTGEFEFSTVGTILNNAEFSVNEGAWKYYMSASTVEKTVSLGDVVRVRCIADSLANNWYLNRPYVGIRDAKYKVYGNIMSLLYGNDFSGKTSFQAGSTYQLAYIFQYDPYIVDAKNLILPATTLAESCYSHMFSGCTSLINGPEILPAATLSVQCYACMFMGCSSLNYVKCLAIDLSAYQSTLNFLYGASPTGTFVKHPNATWPTGFDGIPSGWTVQDAVL